MYFSLIRLHRNASPNDIGALRFDGYQLHKIVWGFFSDGPDRKRDFLYRQETTNGQPTFYTISERRPNDPSGLWAINEETVKPYTPKLARGERLAFKLRANPVELSKEERTANEIESWHKNREERGIKQKEPTKKRMRHDVVMEAKRSMEYKKLPNDQRPHLATLIQKVGLAWLKEKENEFGFFVSDNTENPTVRVDGYRQHRLFKGKGMQPVAFSTLEFNGILTVADPETFVEKCLFRGVGPAKAFGCGLMLVRRI
jgi:CRISPR system Cascade subunit CasE